MQGQGYFLTGGSATLPPPNEALQCNPQQMQGVIMKLILSEMHLLQTLYKACVQSFNISSLYNLPLTHIAGWDYGTCTCVSLLVLERSSCDTHTLPTWFLK